MPLPGGIAFHNYSRKHPEAEKGAYLNHDLTNHLITYRNGLHDHMWIAVVESFDDRFQAFLRIDCPVGHFVANVHYKTPFLLCVGFAGGFLCEMIETVENHVMN